MKVRLTPYYIQLVHDACLKSFWRHKALSKFLRGCGVPDGYLARWSKDETKRDFLDRLFERLLQSDEGRGIILRISLNLIEQKSFPDLMNWEDSEFKIKQAHDAVQRLRIQYRDQEETIRSEEDQRAARKRFLEHHAKVAQAQLSLQKLSERLGELGRKLGTQEAGYEFQEWFFDLADFCEVTNRRPYVDKGRQIDGSLTVTGTTYLVELKFTAKQADAPDIDSLYKKVTSKADNTMGVMVSISGYSQVAKQEASGPRTPLLLLDHSHIYLVLSGIMSLSEVIDRVRRHASQTGSAYLSVNEFGQ